MTQMPEEVRRRIDAALKRAMAEPTPTTPLSKPRIIKELEGVPETRPPQLDTPIMTDDEELEATKDRIELGVARNDLVEVEAGHTPAKYKYPILTGVSAVLIAAATFYLNKC